MYDSTEAMITYLAVRYSQTDTEARVRLLGWLQRAQDQVWALNNWWFKQRVEELSVTDGQAEYTMSAPCANVIEIRNNTPLEFVEYNAFFRNFGGNVTSGTPAVWTLSPLIEPQKRHRVTLWPVPDADVAMKAVIEVAPVTLADNPANELSLPKEHRGVLVTLAEQYLLENDTQAGNAALKKQEFETALGLLMQEDGRHAKVMR